MKTELAQRQDGALTPAITPMQMLSSAVERGTDPDQLQKLMDLAERYEANEAKKAYALALAEFKKDPPTIVKDLTNKQYGSKYSSLANLVNTTNEAMGVWGLNARWDFDQTDGVIKVTCILSHVQGHSERVSLTAPPDTSGSKNPIQQIKSTTTYLKGATFEAVTGIASIEGNTDDDGNKATGQHITEEQLADIECLITEIGADREAFIKWAKTALKVERLEDLNPTGYKHALEALEAKRKSMAK